MAKPNLAKSWCYTIIETSKDDNGYIPCLVVEGEEGYWPMSGRNETQAPWYWGKTYEAAQEVCNKVNAQRGITVDRAAEIVASSMRTNS